MESVSHPVWVRGLKLRYKYNGVLEFTVAPCMSAWIETRNTKGLQIVFTVAPCMGAWIETTSAEAESTIFWSHPVWVRGLKHII